MEPVPELGPCHGHGCDLAEEELFEASSKADELDVFSLCIITTTIPSASSLRLLGRRPTLQQELLLCSAPRLLMPPVIYIYSVDHRVWKEKKAPASASASDPTLYQVMFGHLLHYLGHHHPYQDRLSST